MGLLKCYPSSKDRIYWGELLSKSMRTEEYEYVITTITTLLYWRSNRQSVLESERWENQPGCSLDCISKCELSGVEIYVLANTSPSSPSPGIIIVNQVVIKLLHTASSSSSSFSSSFFFWFDSKIFLYNSSYISSLAGINLVDDANWRAETGGILFKLIDFKIALSLNRV